MDDVSGDPVTGGAAALETERLVLRAWTQGEAVAVVEGGRRDDWCEDFPADGDRSIAPLVAAKPEWLGPFGHRLVVERASGLVVGALGLFWPPKAGAVELGYGIAPSRRGRGYAPEAVRALVAQAFKAPEVRLVFATVEPANPASVRVLQKAGFTPAGVDQDQGLDRYELPRP
ncbi:GNAT family N-acetyltransferase [Glycomyces sp. NPDC047010]|uniref:GNAT family N-acetyltransferase n=1 Tax=Glycomyces sp. NPDC047010 TaxID=3155023 RepID=UPI0033EB3E84